jgi:hypothetical protein
VLMAEGGSTYFTTPYLLISPQRTPHRTLAIHKRRRGASGFVRFMGGRVVVVAESILDPPGPIPNPVVTQESAGEYCGGDPVGGEAAATTTRPHIRCVRALTSIRRGVEQRQLVGLITQRSRVRIPPPPPHYAQTKTPSTT